MAALMAIRAVFYCLVIEPADKPQNYIPKHPHFTALQTNHRIVYAAVSASEAGANSRAIILTNYRGICARLY